MRRVISVSAAVVMTVTSTAVVTALPASASDVRTVCSSGCQYTTIQSAITAAQPGDTIDIKAGTYAENLSINKRLSIIGAGSGGNPTTDTIITAAATGTSTVVYTTGGDDSTARQVLRDVRVTGASGGTGNNNSGILLSGGSIGFFTFDNVTATANTGNGLVSNVAPATSTLTDVIIRDSLFSSNGALGIRTASHNVSNFAVTGSVIENNASLGLAFNSSDNPTAQIGGVALTNVTFSGNSSIADLYAFRMLGTMSLTNVDFQGSNGSGLFGLYLLGGYVNQALAPAIGTVTLNDVTVSGTYTSAGISFLGYSDLANVSMTDVVLDTVIPTPNRGHMRLSGVAGTLDIGNTSFDTSTTPLDILLNANFDVAGSKSTVDVDATDATFDGKRVAQMTLAEQFDEQDRILDVLSGEVYAEGLVTLVQDTLFATAENDSIQRAIDAASSDDTIFVQAGTYEEGLTINKSLTVSGPNSDVSPNAPEDPWLYNSQGRVAEAAIHPGPLDGAAVALDGNVLSVRLTGLLFDLAGTQDNYYNEQPFIETNGIAERVQLSVDRSVFQNAKAVPNRSTNGNWTLKAKTMVLDVTDSRFTGSDVTNGIAAWGATKATLAFSSNVWLDNKGWLMNTNLASDVTAQSTQSELTFQDNWVGNTKTGNGANNFPERQSGLVITSPWKGVVITGNTFKNVEAQSVNFYVQSGNWFQGQATVANNLFEYYNAVTGTGEIVAAAVGPGTGDGPPSAEDVMAGVSVNFNAFIAQPTVTNSTAVTNRPKAVSVLDAADNWWGQATGPETLQIVNAGRVQSSPWIVAYENDPAKEGRAGFWPVIREAEAETPTGTDVEDTFAGLPNDGQVNLTFAQVDDSGTTKVNAFLGDDTTPFPTAPSGFTLGNPPVYYTISTQAVFSGSVEICLSYNPAGYGSDRPTVYHFTGGAWLGQTTYYKTGPPAQACAQVSSFSPFALGVPIPPPPPPAPTFPPSAPVGVRGAAGDGAITASWSAPADPGSFPVTNYQAEALPGGATCLVAAPAVTCAIDGLTNGTAYTVRARALNGAGWSAWSEPSVPVTPGTGVPSAPSNAVAVAGNGEAVVTWTAPADEGASAITGYRVEQSRSGGAWSVAIADTGSTDTIATVTSLVNGDSYRFRVAAINAAGAGPVSDPSPAVTPEDPEAPTILITGQRTTVQGKSGIRVRGETTGLSEGAVLRPWIRFPGQTNFTRGNARIAVSDTGTFRWQRKTGKRITVYVEARDGTRSNRVTIPAR